jgi:hypothetical protein
MYLAYWEKTWKVFIALVVNHYITCCMGSVQCIHDWFSVQGDVGCGKTIVATLGLLKIIDAGYQVFTTTSIDRHTGFAAMQTRTMDCQQKLGGLVWWLNKDCDNSILQITDTDPLNGRERGIRRL